MDTQPNHETSSFKEIASLTLGGYQLLEAMLKTYLHNYFQIAKCRVGSDLHFAFSGDDYDKAALGTLLKVFSKTCADSALVKDLLTEIPHRDQVAHQALLVLYKRQSCSSAELARMAGELSIRAGLITSLLNRLNTANIDLIEAGRKVPVLGGQRSIDAEVVDAAQLKR